ncbi:MAG: hypothetical protein M3083_04225 [Actinomycetota bacterium]|nr:hypothetical protein [Actinomycetota bacterium]
MHGGRQIHRSRPCSRYDRTPSPTEVVFFEVYENKRAFLEHVDGPIYKDFVKQHITVPKATT